MTWRLLHGLILVGNIASILLFPLHFIYGGDLYRYVHVPSVFCIISGLVEYLFEHRKKDLIVSTIIFLIHVLCTHA